MTTTTPLMTQYLEIKSRYQDAFLFFRMGDFYELFFEDAKAASRILEIALTARNKTENNPVPMCGVPHHSATQYINRLVSRGHKVAICEQLEDPSQAKGIVKRDVVQVITPGTQLNPEALEAKSLNLTTTVYRDKDSFYFASVDFSSGFFTFGVFDNREDWTSYIQSEPVVEILFSEEHKPEDYLEPFLLEAKYFQKIPDFYLDPDFAKERLKEQFLTDQWSAIHPSLAENKRFISVSGALVKYFQTTQNHNLRIPLVEHLRLWTDPTLMELDYSTMTTLELFPKKMGVGKQDAAGFTLFHLLDRTETAAGGRLLKTWISQPLIQLTQIQKRQNLIEGFLKEPIFREELKPILKNIFDLERLMVRLTLGSANPRDLKNLAESILLGAQAGTLYEKYFSKSLIRPESALLEKAQLILNALVETPPFHTKEGGIFKKGFHAPLDELIELTENGTQWLLKYEQEEKEKAGISSLKVRFNRVYGYYIEITKSNIGLAPKHYIRKQTMTTGERYITEELKTFEEKILSSESKRQTLELELFKNLSQEILAFSSKISALSSCVSQMDVIASLSSVAEDQKFNRPEVTEGTGIHIEKGRHPTVELRGGFVENDVSLSIEKNLMLITGPNMGGKSTIMRQTALIVLMAQMGSFVPAEKAEIGIVDRIFTRIGANDNIAQGQSTFMVEMNEMSYILRSATQRSLILLDEIGRGTSTFDGLSLAWALAEEVVKKIKARTLFATHYHELVELEKYYPQAFNMQVAVDCDKEQQVRFLYKLMPGASRRSYGIFVARLAGLPPNVLSRAEQILTRLESQKMKTPSVKTQSSENVETQLSFLN